MRYSVLLISYSTWLVFLLRFVTVLVNWTLICASDCNCWRWQPSRTRNMQIFCFVTGTAMAYPHELVTNTLHVIPAAEYRMCFCVFDGVYRWLRETGSISRRRADLGRPRVIDDDEEQDNEIVQRFRADPTTSTNAVARELGLSQWKVWFTVNTAGLYPYHYTPVQVIEEGDPVRRLDFCRFMLNADLEDPAFLRQILWTDELKVDKDGITNYHNAHYWAKIKRGQKDHKEDLVWMSGWALFQIIQLGLSFCLTI